MTDSSSTDPRPEEQGDAAQSDRKTGKTVEWDDDICVGGGDDLRLPPNWPPVLQIR